MTDQSSGILLIPVRRWGLTFTLDKTGLGARKPFVVSFDYQAFGCDQVHCNAAQYRVDMLLHVAIHIPPRPSPSSALFMASSSALHLSVIGMLNHPSPLADPQHGNLFHGPRFAGAGSPGPASQPSGMCARQLLSVSLSCISSTR
jgi:hypothetical protein